MTYLPNGMSTAEAAAMQRFQHTDGGAVYIPGSARSYPDPNQMAFENSIRRALAPFQSVVEHKPLGIRKAGNFLRTVDSNAARTMSSTVTRAGATPMYNAVHNLKGVGDVVGPTSPAQPISLATTDNPNSFQSIINSITQIGTSLVGIKNADALARINLQRAQQGLAPLTAEQAGTSPTMNVKVDVSDQVKQGTQQIMLYGAIGAAALLGLLAITKKS